MYDISIVIPTHNRAEMVCQNVAGLANQTMSPSRYEVIVIADGCEDGTVENLRSLDVPFRLRVIEQAAQGAATARNAGAHLAESSLLVFLDDDMYAEPGLLLAHWHAQSTGACLLIGYFSVPASCRSDHPFAAFANEWWDSRFHRLGLAGIRYSFLDVCTGHMSVLRRSFLDIGCFDDEIGRRAGEDYEFGIRWLKSGNPIRYCPAARSQHLDRPSIEKALNRAYAEGQGHALMARRHPECFMALPLRAAFDGQPWIHIRKWHRLTPRRARWIPVLARPVIRLAGAVKLRRLFAKSLAIARTARYWKGVLDESSGLEGLRKMIQDIPYEHVTGDSIVIDIQQAPEVLARRINETRPRTVSLVAGEEAIGYIGDFPGSAPIDWQQVVCELERFLDTSRLAKPRPPVDIPLPPISVVVCTRDRPVSLGHCLKALSRLLYPEMEVIVIDNASETDDTRRVVSESGFKYFREDRPGLNWARNRGWQQANNDLVAYIDDDALADESWLRGIARGFRDPKTAAVTGLVLPEELWTDAQRIFESYANGMSKGMSEKTFRPECMSAEEMIRSQDVGVGTNMAYRRLVLQELNGFDTALDVGTPSCGGGDLDMLHRVLVSRHNIAYEPAAVVRHRHRRDMEGLIRQIQNNGRSYGVYLMKLWREGNVPKSTLFWFATWKWGRWLVGRPIQRLVGSHRLPMQILVAELRGALSAPWAYRKTYQNDRRIRREFGPRAVYGGKQYDQ